MFRTLGYIGTNFARSEQSFVLTRNERAEALPNPPTASEIRLLIPALGGGDANAERGNEQSAVTSCRHRETSA